MKKLIFNVTLYSTDYTIFKKLVGNRPLTEVKVKRFMKEFAEKQLPWQAVLNEFMEVIDGQHKIEACKRMGLPVPYVIVNGLRLEDAQAYNRVGSIWNKPEHLESHVELGNENYIKFKEFMKNYPDFSQGVAESIFTNRFCGANANKGIRDEFGKLVGKVNVFQNGDMKMADIVTVYNNASAIMKYKPYFKKYNTGMFVKTMIALLQHKKFDNDKMIRKLQFQSTKLVQCATVKQYRELIQDIYNWHETIKVNLLF